MQNKTVLHKTISDVAPMQTSHGVGEKRVLFSQKEFSSPITQLAQTRLQKGTVVENHTHATMDEHFIFLRGKCMLKTDGEEIICEEGQYLFVPAGVSHQINVLSDADMITVGVAIE